MASSENSSTQRSAATRAGCRRQRVVGVDLWVDCPCGGEQTVPTARSAAIATHPRLVAAPAGRLEEGASRDKEHGGLRLRFATRRHDVHVTDEAIWELLDRLCGRLRWSRLPKLEEFDGIPSVAPLPAL